MITTEQLDSLKLVIEENAFLSEKAVLDAVEIAVTQGSGGWGVRRQDGVVLTLARQLKGALERAERADEAYKTMKGLQMENGRLKKWKENHATAAAAMESHIKTLEETLVDERKEHNKLKDQFNELAGVDGDEFS